MNWDASSIGLIGLLLAAAGVLATLIAPRFAGSSRILARVTDVASITPEAPTSGITISVIHNGAVIDRDVFLLSADVQNTGSKDIVHSHFVDPIEFALPDEFEVVSTEVAAPNGVLPLVATSANKMHMTWRILKPRETVLLKAILAAPRGTVLPSKPSEVVRQTVRLIDVRVAPPLWRGREHFLYPITAGLVIMATVLLASAVLLIPEQPDLITFPTQTGEIRALLGRNVLNELSGGLQACRVFDEPRIVAECVDISAQDVRHLSPILVTGSGWIGAPMLLVNVFLSMFVAFGIIGVALVNPRTTQAIVDELAKFTR